MNFHKRLERLRKLLPTYSCEALLVENPVDILYLTGLSLSAGKLVISEKETSLMVDQRYTELSAAQSLYPVRPLSDNSLKEWICELSIQALAFDQNFTSYGNFLKLAKMAGEIRNEKKHFEIIPSDSPVKQLRIIKDEDEIEALRKAALLGCSGYKHASSLLVEGISEADIAFELEFFWKRRGASRLAFEPIIAFGSNGSMPHYRSGNTKLTSNTSVLMDIGVVLNHYHSDMTRVRFFGSPPPEIKVIYEIVEEAKNRALSLCRPGSIIGDIDKAARDWISKKGYGKQFLHSLGHGIGLEIHEPPFLRQGNPYSETPLQAGMVITIEPGIYLPGIGGVRLEDTILITESGYENFTKFD